MHIPWGRVIQGAVLYYVIAALSLHVLQPGRSPLALPMSGYVHGRGGILMTVTFFALAVALLAAASGLHRTLPRSWALRLGVLFMILGAVAVTVAGIFPSENVRPPQLPVTPVGRTHMFAGLIAFPSFFLGPLLLTLAMRRHPGWRSATSVLGGIVALVGLTVISFGRFAAPRGLAGLAQRSLLALLFIWLLVVAARLVRSRSEAEPA